MATTSKTALTSKIAELRQLKLEEDALRKLSTQMRDQMNRLKVEELTLKSQLREREIQLNTLSHSGEADLRSSVTSNVIHGSQASSDASQVATTSAKWEAEQKVNHLIDLDLQVPTSPVFQAGNYSASTDEESDEDELIFNM